MSIAALIAAIIGAASSQDAEQAHEDAQHGQAGETESKDLNHSVGFTRVNTNLTASTPVETVNSEPEPNRGCL